MNKSRPTLAPIVDVGWEIWHYYDTINSSQAIDRLHHLFFSEVSNVKWSGKTGQRAKMYPTLTTNELAKELRKDWPAFEPQKVSKVSSEPNSGQHRSVKSRREPFVPR